jgi:repressor LexA
MGGTMRGSEEVSRAQLTERQTLVWRYIADYIKAHQRPPVYREIQDQLGVSSVSMVQADLKALKAAGVLTWEPDRPRTLELLRRPV